jgi:hypothetical protein
MRKLKRTFKSERWNPISKTEIKILIFITALLTASISSCGQDTLRTAESVPFHIQKPKAMVYEQPVDIGNDVARYKGSLYPINTGIKKGRFVIYKGKKVYLKKTA